MDSDGGVKWTVTVLVACAAIGITTAASLEVGAQYRREIAVIGLWFLVAAGLLVVVYYLLWPVLDVLADRRRRLKGGEGCAATEVSVANTSVTDQPTGDEPGGDESELPVEREFANVSVRYLGRIFNDGHYSTVAKRMAQPYIGKWIEVAGPLGNVGEGWIRFDAPMDVKG